MLLSKLNEKDSYNLINNNANDYNENLLNVNKNNNNNEIKIEMDDVNRNSNNIANQLNPLVMTINIPIIVTKDEPSKSSAPERYTMIPNITQIMRNINCII